MLLLIQTAVDNDTGKMGRQLLSLFNYKTEIIKIAIKYCGQNFQKCIAVIHFSISKFLKHSRVG